MMNSSSNHPAAANGASLLFERIPSLWPLACIAAIALACLFTGCQPAAKAASDVNVKLELSPTPPHVGTTDVVVSLTDASEQPVAGATLRLEGNMNHAGMKPVFSDLKETESGRYEGTLEFTMGGDWFVLVSGQLPDGSQLDDKIDVPGVASK